jgi:hypothetical protein
MSVATYQSTMAGGVAEDAKSSESMLLASGGWIGIFGKFRYEMSWRGFGGQILGVWKQFFKCVAIADLGLKDRVSRSCMES